jgi:hypothetical protein
MRRRSLARNSRSSLTMPSLRCSASPYYVINRA